MGFNGHLKKITYFDHLLKYKRGDLRAVLNALQFREPIQIDQPENDVPLAVSLKEVARLAKQTASMDSACGRPKTTSWRSKELVDLDYAGGILTKEWELKAERDGWREELVTMLNRDEKLVWQIQNEMV